MKTNNLENKVIVRKDTLKSLKANLLKLIYKKGIKRIDMKSDTGVVWSFFNFLVDASRFKKTGGYPCLDTFVHGLDRVGLEIHIVDKEDLFTYSEDNGVIIIKRNFYPRYTLYLYNKEDLTDFRLICVDNVYRSVERLRDMYKRAFYAYFNYYPSGALSKKLTREFNKICWAIDKDSEISKKFIIKNIDIESDSED